jgi:hypothetical protein
MTRPSLSSLRARLLLLVLLALIPARGLGVYTAWERRLAAWLRRWTRWLGTWTARPGRPAWRDCSRSARRVFAGWPTVRPP